MTEVFTSPIGPPAWVIAIQSIQIALVLWLAFVVLLGSWKLFRFLIKWKP